MSLNFLDFEQPIAELEAKIDSLTAVSQHDEKIDINIDGLKKNADTIAAKKQELQTLNKNLENLIKEINDKWEGEASVSYVNMLNKYLTQAKKMESVLNEFYSYTTNVSNTFQNLDQNAAGNINR